MDWSVGRHSSCSETTSSSHAKLNLHCIILLYLFHLKHTHTITKLTFFFLNYSLRNITTFHAEFSVGGGVDLGNLRSHFQKIAT